MAALIGGGSGQIRPGCGVRAHRGVLFLDEAPEFPRAVLDTLRQPLERGAVTIAARGGLGDVPVPGAARAGGQPVPLRGRGRGDRLHVQPLERRRYGRRVSGPLLDRIDLRVDAAAGRARAACSTGSTAPSRPPRWRSGSGRAREVAAERLRGTGWRINADVPGPQLRTRWRLPAASPPGPTTARPR